MNQEIHEAMEALVQICIKRYEHFSTLAILEMHHYCDDETLEEVKKDLQVLELKEDRLVDMIKNNMELFEDDFYLSIPLPQSVEPSVVHIITSRIDSVLSDLDDFLFDDEIVVNKNYEHIVRESVQYPYLIELQKHIDKAKNSSKKASLIADKYNYIFASKQLDNELSLIEYNPNNLIIHDQKTNAKMLEIDEEEYDEILNDALYDRVQDIINDLQSEKQNKTDYLELKFLLKKLDTEDLIIIREECLYLTDKNEEMKKVIKFINKIMKKRGDVLENYKEKEELCEPLDEQTAQNLINLVKLDEIILNTMLEGNFEKLESLNDLEQDLIKQIKITKDNKDTILEVLDNGISICLDENTKESLIKERIVSSIPDLYAFTIPSWQMPKSAYHICHNHELESLISFYEYIKEIDEELKETYYKIYIEEYFTNYSLTKDFIVTRGNADNNIVLNLKDNAKLIGLSEIEYAYDKDEQLYDRGIDIIEELLYFFEMNPEDSVEDEYGAYIDYLLIQLENILDNVSFEHFLKLTTTLQETAGDNNLIDISIKEQDDKKDQKVKKK